MHKTIFNYTKTCRKKTGLSRKEIAYLFGMKSGYFIGKTEKGNITAVVYRAIAYEMLFNEKLNALFPELSKTVALEISKRIAKLSNKLERKNQSAANRRKLEFLTAAAISIAVKFKKYESRK